MGSDPGVFKLGIYPGIAVFLTPSRCNHTGLTVGVDISVFFQFYYNSIKKYQAPIIVNWQRASQW